MTLIFICALWAFVAFWALSSREETIQNTGEVLRRMNSGVEEQTRRLFSMVDIFLTTCDQWLDTNPGSDPRTDPAFNRLIEEFSRKTGNTIGIRLVAADGSLFYVPAKSPGPLAKVGDRDYVRGALQMPPAGLFIGAPTVSRVSDKYALPISLKLKHPSHGISIVVAVIDLNTLISLYDQQRAKPNGAIVLVRSDGIVLARAPSDEKLLGSSVAKGKIFSKLLPKKPQDLTLLEPTATDGLKKFASYSSMADYPLIMVVSSGYDDALSQWSRQLLWGCLIALCVTFAAIAAAWRSMRLLSVLRQRDLDLSIVATAFESQEGMMVTDANGIILRVNHAFTEITGYSADEAIGRTPRMLKSGRHDADFYRTMWDTLKRTGGWQGEVWDRRKNGEIYPKWLTISAVKSKEGAVTNYVGTHFDITERKNTEDKINKLAFFDQLTGLPNRTLLLDRLRQAMTAGARSGNHGALLFIDLDNFKTLNDTLGHDVGDLLLKQVAQRLTEFMRAADTVARMGGDEFVVMLAGLSTIEAEAAAQAEIVAKKILAMFSQTFFLNEVAHHSTPSIGAALFVGLNTEIDELLKQADLAMYKSKSSGRNTVRFFDPDMEADVLQRASLETELRAAVEEQQFLLHYQAQVVGDGQVTGAEVLLRWRHPQRGMVSPAEFIPLAEESGLILPMGHWVMETACRQLALWAGQDDMAHLTIAVNVSALQFRQRNFVDDVIAILDGTAANPRRLKLELTESVMVENVQDIIEKMFALKAKGVGFSMDDFGTGYSSLTYLKRLPLDQLKIDQSFVRDVLIDPNDAAIACAIVTLAQSLGLGVIAEGVETDAQRAFLASSGCHAYQGYFFSRPLPLEGFEAFARGG